MLTVRICRKEVPTPVGHRRRGDFMSATRVCYSFGPAMPELEKVQALYDRSLFLQAYGQTVEYWSPSTDLSRLSLEELVLASRLASRLGGSRLSRHLCRGVYERDPANPRVRYFTQGRRRRGWHLADDLRAFEENPLEGAPEIQSSWLGSYPAAWARLRDFDRADQCIERAFSLVERDGWVLACASNVADLADRWEEGLELAERASEIEPHAPYVVHTLCDSLASLGRLEEAAERAAAAADQSESYEVVLAACWSLCTLAETLDEEERVGTMHRARRLANRLPVLAP